MISYQWIRQELPVSHGCPAKEQIDVVCLKNARQSAAHLIQALLQTDVLYLIDAQRKKIVSLKSAKASTLVPKRLASNVC